MLQVLWQCHSTLFSHNIDDNKRRINSVNSVQPFNSDQNTMVWGPALELYVVVLKAWSFQEAATRLREDLIITVFTSLEKYKEDGQFHKRWSMKRGFGFGFVAAVLEIFWVPAKPLPTSGTTLFGPWIYIISAFTVCYLLCLFGVLKMQEKNP